MADYTIKVTDITKRQMTIKQKCAHSRGTTVFHQHGSKPINLDVIEVDIGLLLYRMANWRTQSKQRELLHKLKLDTDYFSSGEENVRVQKVQHDLLVEFAKKGKGESVVPIFDVLEKDKRQTEPLLITDSGVVLNGNRRLAAMRELFASDPGTFPFGTVEVLVLPAALTPAELKRIEFKLQMQLETKLPYGWTDECMAVRELHHNGMSKMEIMQLMRVSKESEVQDMIDRVEEAESYLTDYLKKPEEYSRVADQEQQFIELQKAITKKTDEGERELARTLCHVITSHSKELGTRAYDFKIAYGSKTKEVAERLAERLNIDLVNTPPKGNGQDVFEDDNGAVSTSVKFSPIAKVLRNKANSKDLAEAISDICTELKDEGDDEGAAKRPLRELQKIKRTLARLDLAAAAPETIPQLQTTLVDIAKLTEQLRKTIPKARKAR